MKRNQEAYGTRVLELEGIIQKHDEADMLQKRQLNDVKGECHEKLKVVFFFFFLKINRNTSISIFFYFSI